MDRTAELFARLTEQVEQTPMVRWEGRVLNVTGNLLESEGPAGGVGEACEILGSDGATYQGEMIGFRGRRVLRLRRGERRLARIRGGSGWLRRGQVRHAARLHDGFRGLFALSPVAGCPCLAGLRGVRRGGDVAARRRGFWGGGAAPVAVVLSRGCCEPWRC